MNQNHHFFREAPTISKQNGFYRSILTKQWKIETKNVESGHIHFENGIYRVSHERTVLTRCLVKASFKDVFQIDLLNF